ncbi:MAG: AAA family ATPase [Oscillospiraceae bacterium]|nr:AAA family ATPase [Oscillospiraceae bacterium]
MRNTGIQIRVGDVLFAIQKRWKVVVALTFIGLVFGLLLSGMTYVQGSLQSYEISGSFAISTRPLSGEYINGTGQATNNDFTLSEQMVDAVLYVMRSQRVLDQTINDQQLLGVNAGQIRNNLSIRQYEATQILEVTLIWSNAEDGLAIWNGIVSATNELLPQVLMLGSLQPINEPAVQRLGAGGSGGNLWAFMAVLGFAAGIGFALMELLMHPTLTNVKDVETVFGLETLGTIPENSDYYRRKTSLLVEEEGSFSEITQNYAASAYILRNRLGSKEKHHCFYVTSAINREGRSTVAANLAIQLSDMEQHTLLIDLDNRNPTLGMLFLSHVDYDHSLNALYRGDCTEQEAITTLTGYLDILPMVLEHNVVAMDGMILDLIQRLSEQYDYIILDAPPVGKESETLSLNQVTNTALYVIGYDKATIPEIQGALDKLDKSGVRVLGCIVNGTPNGHSHGQPPQKAKKRAKKESGAREPGFRASDANETEESLTALAENRPVNRKKKPVKASNARRGRQETAAPDSPVKNAASGSPAGRKNVFEDLMVEERAEAGRSDMDTMSELLKLGLDETWGDNGETTPEPPKGQTD